MHSMQSMLPGQSSNSRYLIYLAREAFLFSNDGLNLIPDHGLVVGVTDGIIPSHDGRIPECNLPRSVAFVFSFRSFPA